MKRSIFLRRGLRTRRRPASEGSVPQVRKTAAAPSTIGPFVRLSLEDPCRLPPTPRLWYTFLEDHEGKGLLA